MRETNKGDLLMKTTMRTRLLASSLLIGAATIANPAAAQVTSSEDAAAPATQDTPSTAEPSSQGDIVVTGSLIRNPNLVSSSPVATVGQAELQLRNTVNAETIIREIPGTVPGIGSQVNNGNGGFSTINLRGLGSQRNLVLIDGNRLVPAEQNGTVDLNNIPVALLERVDVLTGGASTTYGADAVSGVVNFITRSDFAGVEASASNRITERGDSNIFRADLTIGANFDDGRGNAVLSVGYQEADALYQGDRDISVFGISSTTGVASGESFTSTPTAVSFPSGDFQVNPAGTALQDFYSGFNFNPYNIFQTPFKRYNIYAAANYEVSDTVEVYSRGIFSKNTVSTIIAPSGIFGEALTIPGNNPYLSPGIRDQLCTLNGIALGAPCNTNAAIPLPAVYRRSVELGPRVSEYVTTMFDYKAGVRLSLTDTLKFDVSGAYGENEINQTQSGYVLRSRVQQALNATNTTSCTVTTNNCVPLNLFGPAGSISPDQAAFLNGSSIIQIKTNLSQFRGILTGDLGSIGSGEPISFAVGGEYRDYGYVRNPDAYALSPGELGGAGGAVLPFDGGYDVREAFGEVIAPILADVPFFHSLTLEAGIRYSSYQIDAAGDPSFETTTWKVGGSWEPVEAIKVRGNYQRAVRAPNINELFSPVSTGLTNLLIDPCAGAAPTASPNLALACTNQGAPVASIGSIQNPSAGQANATGGGNPLLEPEEADTYTVGVVIQPRDVIPGLTLTVDYYNIIINNAITQATPADILGACFGANPSAITAAQANSVACTSIRRSSANGRLSGSSATIPGLPQPRTNLGRLATDGIDLVFNYARDFGDVGFVFNFAGNWTNKSTFQASETSFDRDCVGYYSVNCASIQPEFSWNTRATFSVGDADLSVLWRYIDSVRYEGIADDAAARGFTSDLYQGVITGPSPLAGGTYDLNRIEAYHYIDLAARFQATENLDLTFTINNLFDRDPPLVGNAAGSTSYNSGNTYPSTYDVLGRTFNVGGRLRF
jgi:iron complex outermembrane recepter protein